jgi:hypothetical protein
MADDRYLYIPPFSGELLSLSRSVRSNDILRKYLGIIALVLLLRSRALCGEVRATSCTLTGLYGTEILVYGVATDKDDAIAPYEK